MIGCGALMSVLAVISEESTAAKSVGIGPEIGSEPSECSKWREAVTGALRELEPGRLDLARERLFAMAQCGEHGG